MKYEIKVEPERSFMDENVSIEITGEAEKGLELRLFSEDFYSINGDIRVMEVGTKWESRVSVVLDQSGRAVLDATVFTTLKIAEAKKSPLEQSLARLAENRSCHIKMELWKGDVKEAEAVHERQFAGEDVISRDVIEDGLLARYFSRRDQEKDGVKGPGVIVVSGSDGRIEKAQAIAQCLARRGIHALAVCYFGMEQVPDDLTQIPLEYIENAISWMKREGHVDPKRIGIYGRSKGGELALLAASLFPELKCVAANTPSCYVQEGFIAGKRTSGHSSWCYQGKEIPYVKGSLTGLLCLLLGMLRKDPFAFRRFYEVNTWKGSRPKFPDARIRLENSRAAFLLLSSDTDGIWPSDRYTKEAWEQLKQQGKGKSVRSLCYSGSGHMLTLPYQPIPNCREYGGTIQKAIPATIKAWKETVDFFMKFL